MSKKTAFYSNGELLKIIPNENIVLDIEAQSQQNKEKENLKVIKYNTNEILCFTSFCISSQKHCGRNL